METQFLNTPQRGTSEYNTLKQHEINSQVNVIEAFLMDNYPHIYRTTTNKEINEWAKKYNEMD